MARNAITVLTMTTMNSSVSAIPTLQAVDTATGAYVDCRNIDATKMILVFTKTASGANSATNEIISIEDGDSKAGYSAYVLGDLKIEIDSDAVSDASDTAEENVVSNLIFAGPFETARFKDSDGRIKINATRGANIAAMGAILI